MVVRFHVASTLAQTQLALLPVLRSLHIIEVSPGNVVGVTEASGLPSGLRSVAGVTVFPGPTTPLRSEHVKAFAALGVNVAVGAYLRDALGPLHAKIDAWFLDPEAL